MKQLDITYDEMDYANVETRRVIWTILDNVRRDTGRDVDPSGNLVIEVAPDSGGGCLLMFTVPQNPKNSDTGTIVAKTNSTQIFEFVCVDDLLDAINAVRSNELCERVFTDGKKYRLEITAEFATQFGHILKEYGRFVGKDSITCAITHEHWQELST